MSEYARALSAVALVLGVSAAGAASIFAVPDATKARTLSLPQTGVRQVVFNSAALTDLKPGGVSQFATSDGQVLDIRWSHSFDHSSGNVTWVGDVAPFDQLNRAALTFFDGGITGTIVVGARQWEVSTHGGGTWVTDFQAAGIKILGAGDDVKQAPGFAPLGAKVTPQSTTVLPRTSAAQLVPAQPVAAAMRDFPRATIAAADAVSTVDVLMVATTELVAVYGSEAATRAVMDRLIAFNNQVYLDSGITNLRLNLASFITLAGTQGMKIEEILNGYNPARPEYIKTSNIAEMREQTGADLVAILIPQDSVLNGGHCGSANLPMLQRDLATQSHEMLSVTASGPAVRGTEFKCGEDAVFVHELGHNFGLMHDRDTLIKQGAPLETQNLAGGNVGSYAYGFGYGVAGKFCDIMCYSQNFGLPGPGNLTSDGFITSRPIFSNPLKVMPSGDAAGVSVDDPRSANAALALTNAAPKVAAYRTPRVAANGSNVQAQDAAAKQFYIQSGVWLNPSEPGRAFFIEINGDRVLLSGYHYGSDGKATWFFAAGVLSNNAMSATMQMYAGGPDGQSIVAGAFKAPVSTASIGTLTLSFDEPDSATLVWPGGTTALVRANFEDGHDNTTESTAPYQALGDSGFWVNPNESGRGFAIEIQGDTIMIAANWYDGTGNPTWYLGNGKLSSFKQFQGQWQSFANGQTPGAPYQAPTLTNANVAGMVIDFSSPTDAKMTLPNGQIVAITRFKF
jgi:hypothetical protein